MRPIVLIVHIVAGSAGLLLGPLSMLLPERFSWHPRAGMAYQVSVALVSATAAVLVLLKPELWFLGLLAVGTEAAALGGWLVSRSRRPGWRVLRFRLIWGSYISLITAVVVVSTDVVPLWFVPTVIGAPVIEVTAHRMRPLSQSPITTITSS
ncbi:MAG: hypothetical protein ACRDH8_06215 [Actinomycetota bacterium]